MERYVPTDSIHTKNGKTFGSYENYSYFCTQTIIIMIAVISNTVVAKQPTKTVSTREHVMANTVSVDEYFDELISQVHQDYADL